MDKRPELRWWLAEGSHTDVTLRASVNEIKNGGFGGVEIVTLTERSLNKARYGWGSEEWNNDMKVILEEATELGLGVSFTSGPNYQPAIPGITPETDAASQELNYTCEIVQPGSTRTGKLRLPDTGNINKIYLEKVVTARLTWAADPENDTTTLLENDAPTDITHRVHADDNTLSWTAPPEGEWILFAFWRHGTGQTGDASSETTYVVNHFDSAGSAAMINFWDRHLLSPEILDLIKKNGRVEFFQDSLEIRTTRSKGFTPGALFWSRDFLNEFRRRRGYDLSMFLPVIIIPISAQGDDADPVFELKGKVRLTRKIRKDYWQTLTELYQEKYLDPIRQWLHQHGMRLRAQLSYGKPLETSLPVQYVDVPESESLYMALQLDGYRQQTGAAHLAGRHVFSSETGAVFDVSYTNPVQFYLQMIHNQFAGGINRTVLHGYACKAGPAASTRWPGYEGIGFRVSERWGDRMPMWRDVNEFTYYIGRLQTVLQEGIQKLDIGILRLNYFVPNQNTGAYEQGLYWPDLSLQQSGFTYEFFAPQMLEVPDLDFRNGVFAPDGPAYKALIVFQPEIPPGAARKLLEFAANGLPVVLIRGAATRSPYHDQAEDELFKVVESLNALPNVRTAGSRSEVPDMLAELGIAARVKYPFPSDLLNVVRARDNLTFLYFYNSASSMFADEIAVEGIGKPYALNPWTGEVTEPGKYRHVNGRTLLNLKLPPAATSVFILDTAVAADSVHATESNAEEVVLNDGSLSIRVTRAGKYTTRLSNGNVFDHSIHVPATFELDNWNLVVEDWQPGKASIISEERPGYITEEVVYGTDVQTIQVNLPRLQPWKDIPAIGSKVSGTGTYSTVFTLPQDWTQNNGAFLELGPLNGTVSVYINGTKTGAINLNEMVTEISQALRKGTNSVEVIVTTPLGNRLSAEGRYNTGNNTPKPFSLPKQTTGDYGLLGPVMITPFTAIRIKGKKNRNRQEKQ